MKNYKIVQEVRGGEKILTIRQGQDEYLNDYLLKMLECNSIYGILPLKSQSMNGNIVLNYFVGNRYKLVDSIKENHIASKEACVIYNRLVDVLTGIDEYFLNADQLVYDLDYLYVDATLNPYMIYVPLENVRDMELNRTWREFFLDLLSYFSAGNQDAFYDKLMRYLIQPNFSLAEFRVFLSRQPASEGVKITSVEEQMLHKQLYVSNNVAVEQPIKRVDEQQNAVAIPGITGENAGTIPKVKLEKENKEKKSSALFGFMKKKEAKKTVGESVQVPVNKQEQALQSVQSEQSGDKWSKTVYIKSVQVDNHTVMLNAVCPHLENKGVCIPIGQYPFTIGKANASYIVANPTVSRLHATISKEGNNYYITDENSSNGTYLNGELLEKKAIALLSDGDKLLLSDEEFTFHTK